MNWLNRIKRAMKSGFTEKDRLAAVDWPTCAGGELTGESDPPHHESELFQLGIAFYEAVTAGCPNEAKTIYASIKKEISHEPRT